MPRRAATSSTWGGLPEGDWAPAAMLALRQYGDDPARGNLVAQGDRPARAPVAPVVRRHRQAQAPVRRGGRSDQVRRAACKLGEAPFRLSREEVRNIGYHLRSPYKRDQQVCKLLLLRLNDEMTRSTTLLEPRDYSVEHVLPQRPAADERVAPLVRRRRGARDVHREPRQSRRRDAEAERPRAQSGVRAQARDLSRHVDDPPVLPITRDAVEASVWRACRDPRARSEAAWVSSATFGASRSSGVQGARGELREREAPALRSDVA